MSKILPDDQMPTLEDGTRAEIIFNVLGIPNRLNPAQNYEQELNYISSEVQKRILKTTDFNKKVSLLKFYFKQTSKKQLEYLETDVFCNEESTKEFVKSVEEKGIYTYQGPFWDNISFERLAELYRYFKVKPKKCYYKGNLLENEIIIADTYVLRMKHEPLGKFSARSTSYIDMKGNPSKSLAYKKKQALFSSTPIKLGEMEIQNLLLSSNSNLLQNLLFAYSASRYNRMKMIEDLLLQNPFKGIDLSTSEKENTQHITFEVLMKSLGIDVVMD